MQTRLAVIRTALDELEAELHRGEAEGPIASAIDIEVGELVRAVVDYLQPLLTPYQAAFYWFLLRRSWLASGSDLTRVSTRSLGAGVVKSSRSDTVSQSQIRDLLSSLEEVGAIRKEGEANRDGTLYRVLLPDDIAVCRRLRATLNHIEPSAVSEQEADYYNVRENRIKIFERDQYLCRYCEKQLTRLTATLDHVVAVVEGGDNSEGNLVTACLSCNSRKSRKPVGDFLAS